MLFTAGLPIMVPTAWAPPDASRPGLIGSLARFVVPTSVVIALFGGDRLRGAVRVRNGSARQTVPDHLVTRFEESTGLMSSEVTFMEQAAVIVAQTGLSVFTCVAAFLLILFGPAVRELGAGEP